MIRSLLIILFTTLCVGSVSFSDEFTQKMSVKCDVEENYIKSTNPNSLTNSQISTNEENQFLKINVGFTDRTLGSSNLSGVLTDTVIEFRITSKNEEYFFVKDIERYYNRDPHNRLNTLNRDGSNSEFGVGFLDIYNFQNRLILKTDSNDSFGGYLITTVEDEKGITHKSLQLRCSNFGEDWSKIFESMMSN